MATNFADKRWRKEDAADQNFDYMFKLLIIGNSSVGKTSFLFRYADDTFTSAFVSTVGIDFKVKTVCHNNKRIKLQIWVSMTSTTTIICKCWRVKGHLTLSRDIGYCLWQFVCLIGVMLRLSLSMTIDYFISWNLMPQPTYSLAYRSQKKTFYKLMMHFRSFIFFGVGLFKERDAILLIKISYRLLFSFVEPFGSRLSQWLGLAIDAAGFIAW